jgi:hypothetical protein
VRAGLLVDEGPLTLFGTEATATFSPCRRYRYALTRTWADAPGAVFVTLNPSTADALADDPTIRRCIGFARAWGCGGLTVVNLFGLRATDPAQLTRVHDPVGPDNDVVIRDVVTRAADFPAQRPVVAAWGAHPAAGKRAREVGGMLARQGVEVLCLGVTAAGHPRHPLYVRGAQRLVSWGGVR